MTKGSFYTHKIAYLAVFIALAAITNIYTWIPVPHFALSFAALPSFFAGAICGPIGGFLTGVGGDVIGQLIAPKGSWLPTITLASGLMGLIPGLIFKFLHINNFIKILISYILTYLICTVAINTTTLWLVFSYPNKTYWVYFIQRGPQQGLVSLINTAITMAIYEPARRTIFKKYLTHQEQSKLKLEEVDAQSIH